ncbi:MAG: hypothetical protein L3J82_02300, partial [Planctomycetes bacterium]|nr:hypothetical protein [Planctomycetota bacterium]
MFKLVHFMAVLIVMASVCTALAAQSYGRTDTTTTYVERAGTGAALPLVDDSYDDGAKFVPLPWDFPFFDRTYKGCWMNTNGRIHFSDEAVDDYDIEDLTATVTEEDLTEAINVYAGDITGSTEWDRASQFTVHYESDRVVFQWKGVANYESDEYGTRLNFQCHIFQSGEIRLYMGPNRFFINDFEDYVSGIVNANGSQSFAGFNNSLLIQQAVPASGNTVTFTPTGYTQADGIVAGPRYGADYTSKVYFEGDTDVVVAQFCLQANGAGGTVTEIGIDNSTPTAGNTLSLKLYLDAGTLGAVDGADTLLATQAMTTGFTTFSGLTEVLDSTTPLRNYLLAVDITAINEDFESYFYFDIDNGDIVYTASIWGGYLKGESTPDQPRFAFLEGPFVEFNVSENAGRFASVTAGGAEVAIASFEVALRESNATSVELNSFEVLITLTGMAIADVSQIALYRDAGSVGQLDGSDTLLATVANPATTTIAFTALTEAMTSPGQDYIITAMVGTSYTTLAVGGIRATVSDTNEVFSVAKAFWKACDNSASNNLSVLPNAAVVFLHDTEETRFDSGRLRVLQGATDLTALQVTLQA